tara:strand:- start:524 stop:1129 length:606 start_codon:yes stop_codon:yes gene_type:complete
MKPLSSIITALAIMGSGIFANEAKAEDPTPIIDMTDLSTDNVSVSLNMGSKHVQQSSYYDWFSNEKIPYNETNPGLGIQYDFATVASKSARLYVTAGGYENSFYETTYYAGLGIVTDNHRFLGPRLDFGAELHATHGYRTLDGDKPAILPLPHLFAEYEIKKNFNLRVGYLPSHIGEKLGFIPDGEAVDVITFSANYKFGN